MLSCGPGKIYHLLLSSGLDYVTNNPDPLDILGTVDDLSQKYARLQVWFANDLDLAVTSGAISGQSKSSDAAKLIPLQGLILTSCGWLRLTHLTKQHSRIDQVGGARSPLNPFTTTQVNVGLRKLVVS